MVARTGDREELALGPVRHQIGPLMESTGAEMYMLWARKELQRRGTPEGKSSLRRHLPDPISVCTSSSNGKMRQSIL